ncbi:MAG: tRNA lysidine(34) synthetase TilS [Clostridia bacterium]|nr:tRNA lysidine(34) synthetase TilS [Clostridia bacterium]
MDAFERHILETIDKYNMIQKGQTVIAAVSGGYDSLCMLNVLCNLRRLREFDVCVAHLNHMLRDEAEGDEEFVVKEAQRLGIKAYTKRVDVSKYAEENKISFETAGRVLRYGFFEEISEKYESTVIATAHNANDSAESMLMHLMRGSGLTGLVGIRPKNENIIRPLIEADRKDIEKYCDKNGLVPRHDCTNDSDDYHRNDIRHNILAPMLERCSLASLCRTMNVLSGEEEFLENYTVEIVSKCIRIKDDAKAINIKDFNKLPVAIRRRVLKNVIDDSAENQLCLVHIDDIITMAKKNYGGKQICLPGKLTVRLEKGYLLFK